jgi:RNA polymerase sigma factor (TIGR02999 family)
MVSTELLRTWRETGSRDALDGLMSALHVELERLARSSLRRERPDHTLETHALLNEAYVRLIDADVDWRDRAHFLAVAARTMRRVLVDHARARGRGKRRAGIRVTLTDSLDKASSDPSPVDVLVLSDAIDRLDAQDARKAQVVELFFFGGLTVPEAAEAMGVSPRTIERELRFARAWLRNELGQAES